MLHHQLLFSHHGMLWVCVAALAFVAHLFASAIEKRSFGTTASGDAVDQFTLTNSKGASASILNYGATVTSLMVPDRKGKLGDVVLGFDNIKQYENESPYFGSAIGRVGNRIAHGTFTVENQRYCVPINNGHHALHGGLRGYDKRIWNADAAMSEGPSVRFTLVDPDGAEGYPGNVNVTIIYSLTEGNNLKIQYFATTDKTTPINLTNHSYFNLKDAGKSDVLGHELKIYADAYTPVDATLIPTGKIEPVKGTPIDFTMAKAIGRDIKAMGGEPGGYDHNLVLRNQNGMLARAAEVYEPETGRFMQVWTTEPGVQLYTGNFLDGSIKGKDGVVYGKQHAFCLETQHYPDAINQPGFPSVLLKPGEVYRQITEYRFSAVEAKPW